MAYLQQMSPRLLTRDEFREGVFRRDRHTCVLCGKPGQDAHHIFERRLFHDGGYYLDNGATVCGPCHLLCEQTLVSCEDLRAAAGIRNGVLPSHMYGDTTYDKWGNPVQPSGMRLKGELFHDENVQKVLADVLHLFTDRVKYPRTHHLPFSPGKTDDDRVMPDLELLRAETIVVTEKLDGENTNLYCDYLHARSLDYAPRVDRDRMKALHASVAHDIPKGWRICGENVWAQHSIAYRELRSFFHVFGMWTDKNECLSWGDTVEYAELLGLPPVPVLYVGPWDEAAVRACMRTTGDEQEGYVVRVERAFRTTEFRRAVGKFVRAGHVQTQAHWTRHIQPNPFVEAL